MDALTIITPEAQAVAQEAEKTLGVVQAARITTPEECQAAVDMTREIKAKAKRLEDLRLSMTRPLDETKKAIMDFFRAPAETLAKAEAALKGSITTFQQEQQRLAAEAEKERQRLQEIERQRLEKERQEAEALLAQAEEAAATGDSAKAEQLEAQAMATQQAAGPISVPVVAAPEKPRGASIRKVWKCRVVNAKLVPPEFTIPNEKALDAYAKSMKENASLPGCEFYSEDSVAIR